MSIFRAPPEEKPLANLRQNPLAVLHRCPAVNIFTAIPRQIKEDIMPGGGPLSRRNVLKSAAIVGVAPAVMPGAFTVLDADARTTLIATPRFRVDPFWPKPLPRDPETGRYWVTGEVAGNAFDSRNRLYTINRRNLTETELRVATPSPAFVVYDLAGNVVNSATPPVLPDGVHGCFVDRWDNVWIAGNGDAIVQKYTHDLRTLLLQIGVKGRFDSSDGTIAGTPNNSSRTFLNRPADIAVDPRNGDVYIADGYGNRRVVVFDRNGNYLRQWGEQGTLAEAETGVGGKFFQVVHGVNLGNDGLVYVNDRKGNRIQVFEKDGAFVRNIWVNRGYSLTDPASPGTSWDLAFSKDRDQNLIYVTDGEEQLLWTITHRDGRTLGSYGRPGHMAGDFTYVHTLDLDSGGDIYTAETIGGRRVQRFRAEARGH
jgi:DNA-binding beta-propeller fold protein YncE